MHLVGLLSSYVITLLKLTNNNKPEELELSESEIPWNVSRITLGMQSVTQRNKKRRRLGQVPT